MCHAYAPDQVDDWLGKPINLVFPHAPFDMPVGSVNRLPTCFIILGIKPYFGRVLRIRSRKFSIDVIAAEL